MHDAGGNEHEKQWHVQHVPDREQSLVNAELDYLPCDLHPSLDVIERNALESVALFGDGFMACSCTANGGANVTTQAGATTRVTVGDGERRECDTGEGPVAYGQQAALLILQYVRQLGHHEDLGCALADC